MEMTPNEELKSPSSNSNPTLVSEVCDRNDENYEQSTSEEEVYTMEQLYEEEVYAAPEQSSQPFHTYNFRRRDNSPQTTSLPPSNERLPLDNTSLHNPPPSVPPIQTKVQPVI